MKHSTTSLGQYLKEQREEKGLSIDEAALETNIAKKYIEALEKDEYGFFPAEMYITGFLTSYIEILELDKELVLSMYKRAVNKEKEAPLEAFYSLHNPRRGIKKYIIWIIIGIPIVLIIVFFSILGFNQFLSNDAVSMDSSINRYGSVTNISLNNIGREEEITVGAYDTIVLRDEEFEIATIAFLGETKNKIKFKIDQNRYTYKVGDILNTDISGNGVNDLSIEVISISRREVEISVIFKKEIEVASFFDTTAYINSIRNTIPIATLLNVSSFNVTVTASRPVWVAYQTDTAEEKQLILESGQSLDFSFLDGVKLSLGNAGAATITFKEFTNTIRGGLIGESSQSLFYKKNNGQETILYRALLK